jgi:hypothetical protein
MFTAATATVAVQARAARTAIERELFALLITLSLKSVLDRMFSNLMWASDEKVGRRSRFVDD